MRLVFSRVSRRLGKIGLLLVGCGAVPVGLSVTGCGHKSAPVVYCNAGDSGPVVGQVASISLSPVLATVGESLNYGQIGQGLNASALDCKGNAVSVSRYIYATSNMAIADINPSNGQVCAGSWNRNTGGGIQDYTVCTANATNPPILSATAVTVGASPFTYTASAPGSVTISGGTVQSIAITTGGIKTVQTSTSGIFTVNLGDMVAITYTAAPAVEFISSGAVAYVTATAAGATSNAIPIFIHPIATGIVLGAATAPASCSAVNGDPGTDCCPNSTVGTPIVAPVYTGNSCISQNTTGQLIARIYQNGDTLPKDNITCSVGHITFAPQTGSIVSIDQNGVATANQPGGTLITATISNSSSGSSAGYFATCPPAAITLAVPGQTGTSVNVSVNNLQPITAVVTDTHGVTLNGLNLEFNSTTPQTIPASTGSVTPTYPGTATITAVCQPGTCNPAPFSQIGLYGNGQPITSNGITVNAVGTASTVIYMGSTSSQYILPQDFTTNQPSSLIKLPYVPNSMVITQDGGSIYLGSSVGMMSLTTGNNTVGGVNESSPGTVLSVSPDSSTVVVTDTTRQTVSLVSAANGGVFSSYGGVGTSARWSPDSQTVYITTSGNTLLVHSNFTNWQSVTTDEAYTGVAVTVPSVGAYFASSSGGLTEGRSYCASGTVTGSTAPPTVNNSFYPLADSKPAPTDNVNATTDGKHILGMHAAGAASTLTDLTVTLPTSAACPSPLPTTYFTSTVSQPTIANIVASAPSLFGVVPAANSSLAFVTYLGRSGVLPLYVPAASGPGTLSYLTLGNGATAASAPVSGVFSTDGLFFYVGTSGLGSPQSPATDTNAVDNDVHIFSISGTSATETGILSPALPPATGTGAAPVNLLVQKPKKTQI